MTDSKLAVSNIIESVVIDGDLSKLTPEQRVQYYQSVCTSLRINPLTRPFNYIVLNGKLTLYATKGAADQLRNIHNVSIDDVTINDDADSITVMVKGHDETGRSDIEIGVVSKKDMQGNQANAKMKAVTKAKRRLTLSLCGLGWLDETEVETIPSAKPINVDIETGEVESPIQEYQDQLRTIEAQKPVINNGQKSTGDRPYSAEIVKKGIEHKAESKRDFVPSEKQLNLLRYGLDMLFEDDPETEDERHTLLKYLTGEASTKNISGKMFKAIVEDWLKMKPSDDGSGEYIIDPIARKEARNILAVALVDEGQVELPLAA